MNKIFDTLKNINYKKLIFPSIFIVIYLTSFIFLYYKISNNKNKNIESNSINNDDIDVESNDEDLISYIYVDIKGEVENPGVYKLSKGSRVNDLINESGGLKEDANTRYINLSKELSDGDAIVIYSDSEIKDAKKNNTIIVETPCVCEEVKNDGCVLSVEESSNENNSNDNSNITSSNNETSTKVNINTASIEELKTLSGIGDAKAKAIIEYRTSNGNFKSIEEITNVSGISESIFSKIKENITV